MVGEDLSGAALSGTVEVTDGSLSYPHIEVARHAVLAVDVVAAQELDTLTSNLVSEADVAAVKGYAELFIFLQPDHERRRGR